MAFLSVLVWFIKTRNQFIQLLSLATNSFPIVPIYSFVSLVNSFLKGKFKSIETFFPQQCSELLKYRKFVSCFSFEMIVYLDDDT